MPLAHLGDNQGRVQDHQEAERYLSTALFEGL